MLIFRLSFFLTLLLMVSCAQKPMVQATSDSPFRSFVGTWSGDYQRGQFTETWKITESGTLEGYGAYTVDGQVRLREDLQIHRIGGHFGYIASINGGKPVLFPLVQSEASRWIFENPEHDFPQRIVYELRDSNTLHIKVDGQMNGKDIEDAYVLSRQ